MNTMSENALSWVRSRPVQFFNSEEVDPIKISAYVMADVLVIGKGYCIIKNLKNWWAICSDQDWFVNHKYSVVELFDNVIPESMHGEHSMRAEIIVKAFSDSVTVKINGEIIRIFGSMPPPEFIEYFSAHPFCIFFQQGC